MTNLPYFYRNSNTKTHITNEERIEEIEQEINFLTEEIEDNLLNSGMWTRLDRLAFWTNFNRIKKLKRQLIELKKQ